ncbi:MAG: Hpt domain-containing protein [Candidatus Electrothrix aestuarii]|uniref:Hpt domain-containing protein n=1 Tax=Candidatus Electrothrix aestuarii TaxID=3062594 RepID=A0AAU8M1B7_9BACT|nr:Hpt domain-containing protein [Candidatus Electrothrix aestuarii]
MSDKLPRSLPCLNIQAGIQQLEGNQDLYIKLLKKFAECNHDLAEKIAERLTSQDDEKARLLAHSTKGVSGSIGATELYLASAALEAAINQGKTEQALQSFSSTLNTVLQSIEALLQDQDPQIPVSPPAERKNVDIETLLPLLDKLDAYLQSGDFQALEGYAALQQAVTATELAEEVNAWATHINHFKYKETAEKLAMLRLNLRNRPL